MLIEGIYLRHLTSLLFVRRSSILKRYSHNQPLPVDEKTIFPLVKEKHTAYWSLFSLATFPVWRANEDRRDTSPKHHSLLIAGKEMSLSYRPANWEGETIREGGYFFLSFLFFFLFLKSEREFSLREWGKNSLVWDWMGMFGIQMIRSFSNFVWHVDDNVIFCFVEFSCVWWIRFINWMWNLNHCHIWENPHNDVAINFWQFMSYVFPEFTMNIYCIKLWKQLKN